VIWSVMRAPIPTPIAANAAFQAAPPATVSHRSADPVSGGGPCSRSLLDVVVEMQGSPSPRDAGVVPFVHER
jgi:hypothetical protein